MATAFPGGVDSFPRPGATTNTDDVGFEHDILHNDVSDAIEAIQAWLLSGGSGASVVLLGPEDPVPGGTPAGLVIRLADTP